MSVKKDKPAFLTSREWEYILALKKWEASETARRVSRSARRPENTRRPPAEDVLDLPVKPFPTLIPHPAKARKGKWITGLLYGDSHHPFHDQRALDVVLAAMRSIKPDVIVHMGDLVDCYNVAPKFDTNPARLLTIQDEIDSARAHLEQVAQVCPTAERYLLEGNHEDRLRRIVWSLPGAHASLAKLTKFQEVMTWPVLLDLDTIGWNWVGAREQTKTRIFPKFITKHGTKMSPHSAYTARAEHAFLGMSGASGHTHRKGTHYATDHNGSHVWIETGCTSTMEPEYSVDVNWQQGFYVVRFLQETGAPHIEDYYIHEGNAMGPGVEYVA